MGYYWSGSSTRQSLIGFCRLRIDTNPGGGFIKELSGCGLIREVHVYGSALGVGSNGYSSQHKGYGQSMIQVAEDIIQQNGLYKSAVIAGVGTRLYYQKKCGYHLEGTYMVKRLDKKINWVDIFLSVVLFFTIHLLIKILF